MSPMSWIGMIRFAAESLFAPPLPLTAGDQAPDFRATDQNGKTVELNDYRGSRVVLWFFPRVNSPG